MANYQETYKLTPCDLVMQIILNILEITRITATIGIEANLIYWVKVAMDIETEYIYAEQTVYALQNRAK